MDLAPDRSSNLSGSSCIAVLLAICLLAAVVPAPLTGQTERYDGPIIDMHLHAYTPETYWGPEPFARTGEPSPATAEQHREATLAAMEEHDVVLGVVSGDVLAAAEGWAERAPDRFLKGLTVYDPVNGLDPETFEAWLEDGRLEVFAEVAAQYGGYSPSDPAFEPYWEAAERHGIPVGIHTGESFPATPYSPRFRDFRVRLGDPLLLEEMLVAHPDLKVLVMHAGGWFWERTLQLMQMYPQVYAGVGVLGHAPEHRTTETLERFLERAEAFGYLDRVVFGSDQMIWPEAIGVSVEAVQSLDFLTVEEKRAIFYDNAARFLGLSEEEIARHHGRKRAARPAGQGKGTAAEGDFAPPRDSTAVVEAVDRFLRAFEDLDWETFRGSFTEDATVFSPVRTTPERSGWESVFRPVFESIRERAHEEGAEGPPFMQLRPRDLRVRTMDGAALVTFHLGQREGSEVGRRTLVLRETGGRWRIVHVHASTMETREDAER